MPWSRWLPKAFALLAALWACFLFGLPQANAQEELELGDLVGLIPPIPPGWKLPRLVSEGSGYNSSRPDLTIGPQGRLHVTWEAYLGDRENQAFYSRQTPQETWSPSEITPGPGVLPSIAVAPDGTIHIASNSESRTGIYSRRRNPIEGWTEPDVLSTGTYPYVSLCCLSLAADGDGNIHAVWSEIGNNYRIVYRKFSQGSWSWVYTGISDGQYPQIAVEPNNVIHLVWKGRDGKLYYKHSTPQESGSLESLWSTDEIVSLDAGPPAMGVSPEGIVHVAWAAGQAYESTEIYYSRRALNGVWTEKENISQTPDQSSNSPTLAVIASDLVHFAWVDGTQVWYRRYAPAWYGALIGSTSWTEPEEISAVYKPKGAYSPSLVATGNPKWTWDVHVVWHQQTPESGFHAQIIYRKYKGASVISYSILAVVSLVVVAAVYIGLRRIGG